MNDRLITREEYQKLTPKQQGFVIYMQAELPGSELKEHQQNPYSDGTPEHSQWDEGQLHGVLVAQDSEE